MSKPSQIPPTQEVAQAAIASERHESHVAAAVEEIIRTACDTILGDLTGGDAVHDALMKAYRAAKSHPQFRSYIASEIAKRVIEQQCKNQTG
jgi:hypothetical protein